jgi:hypothetical protein
LIISHKHRYIFVKTSKTAGTSVEIALSKHCGPDDIITPISLEDEVERRALGYPGPQNHLADYWHYGLRDWARRRRHGRQRLRFYNHMSSAEIRAIIPPDIWNEYFKFCVERNPWDRVMSLYHYRYPTEPRPSIDNFLKTNQHFSLKDRGRGLYTINDKIVVDHVCRYDNLAGELEMVRQRVGISEPLVLPRAKSRFRADKRHYREVLTPEAREIIERDFTFEIAQFGFMF